MNNKKRVLIIGLDGASLDLIKPWAQAGYLPNLHALMKNGTYGKLLSVQPVVSAPAWATFMTGTNPGKHGVYDFVYRETSSYRLRPTTRQHISEPSLWRILSEQNRKVGVINVPMTYPPEPVNGFIVSGLGTPNFKQFTYPPSLSDLLLKQGYRVNRNMYYPDNDEKGFLEDTFDLIESIQQAAKRLIQEFSWDFFMVVFRDTDDVSHGFWRYMDPTHPRYEPDSAFKNAILKLYQKLDQYIGELIEIAGDDTNIIIMSDHGFGPLYKDVYLNEWLRQKGYLVTHEVKTQHKFLSRFGVTRSNVSRILRATHLGKVEKWVKDFLGDKIEILPRNKWPDFNEGIDWGKTRAFSFGYQGQIYINLAEREPHGIVHSGKEYDQLIEELTQDLKGLIDPEDGLPVVDNIYYKNELYSGSHIKNAPDLVLVMRGLKYITRLGFELGNHHGAIFGISPVNESGGHKPNGILIASGPAFNPPKGEMPTAWLGDITPTVLHLLDCAIPTRIDGKVLHEWLNVNLAHIPVNFIDTQNNTSVSPSKELSKSEEHELMQRLSDLGYLN